MDVVTDAILDKVKDIDYGCCFENGECVAVEKRIARGLKPLRQICCRGCFHNTGYLGIKQNALPDRYKAYFSYPDGFLGKNGCVLPVDMRSRKCVIYVCRDADIADKNRTILKRLEEST